MSNQGTGVDGMRLLLVDDDEGTRFIVKRALAHMGTKLHVHEAASGEEAIALLDQARFDVILTDFKMGGKNGVDVLCHALERQPEARRVLMSGTLPEAMLRVEASRACVQLAFEKPMEREAWEPLLRAALTPVESPGSLEQETRSGETA